MLKFRRKIYKYIALNTLVVIAMGSLCIAMFTPPAMAGMAMDSEAMMTVPHDHELVCRDLNLLAPQAQCCVDRSHATQAITNSDNYKKDFYIAVPAVLADAGLILAADYNGQKPPLDIFPPPEGAALRSVVKRE